MQVNWTILGLALGCLGAQALPPESPEAEPQAIAAIRRLGGAIVRDEGDATGPVIRVDLSFSKATDDDLAVLPGLPAVRELRMGGTNVTDAGLKHVGRMKQLQAVD